MLGCRIVLWKLLYLTDFKSKMDFQKIIGIVVVYLLGYL